MLARTVPHPGATLQVITNTTDVCAAPDDAPPRGLVPLSSYIQTNQQALDYRRIDSMIDAIVRQRIRDKLHRRRHRRHRSRRRKARQRHEQRQTTTTTTRDRRATNGARRNCLPAEAFGLSSTPIHNLDGSKTKIECCYPRGYRNDGYLNLCAVCSATTTLPEHYFPSDVHEYVCLGALLSDDSGADGCVRISNAWHGRCLQKTMHQIVFRRKHKCNVHLTSLDSVNVQEWRQEVVPVRSGCECGIDEFTHLSDLADEGI